MIYLFDSFGNRKRWAHCGRWGNGGGRRWGGRNWANTGELTTQHFMNLCLKWRQQWSVAQFNWLAVERQPLFPLFSVGFSLLRLVLLLLRSSCSLPVSNEKLEIIIIIKRFVTPITFQREKWGTNERTRALLHLEQRLFCFLLLLRLLLRLRSSSSLQFFCLPLEQSLSHQEATFKRFIVHPLTM